MTQEREEELEPGHQLKTHLNEVKYQGTDDDGSCVHHRVVGTSVVVEDQFIEHASTRLLTHEGVDSFSAEAVECNGVVDWFATGLDGERG